MIHLMFTLVLAEMALILTLLFRTPLRKLVMMGLDRLKQGRGRLVANTVAATMTLLFSSIIYQATIIHKRSAEASMVNPTEEVLMAQRQLEASLIGFSLFLALIIDRLYYLIKELYLLRMSLEAAIILHQAG
ncbi:uncharacterized protein LOC121235221 [Juglans microcarpa x Juglans regia]|uniref:uncharacterized protein LOC121235221 n=1 Tax=Juglans microcarpa x Juglans regia TaxID=2249226 RepID=UPI001B7DF4A3|nr:uncharacterized protein LOC121235221 [Juglans microcarpa x Juglans regia]